VSFASEHSAAFLAFEAVGGYWQLLEVLSDVKGLPPPQRGRFFGQLEDAGLLAKLVAALGTRGPSERAVRLCVRNLARSPDVRTLLLPAVPQLVADLEQAGLVGCSAAALCNLGCHSDGKIRAVEGDAVRQALAALCRGLATAEATEDLVALLGVLTGGYEPGIRALFAEADATGEAETFGPLVALLGHVHAPPLQCIAIDVLGGICAASPHFKAWLVKETLAVSQDLPNVLRSPAPPVRFAALEFACLLVEVDGFREAFQKGGGEAVLRAMLESEPPAPPRPTGFQGGLMAAAFSGGATPALARGGGARRDPMPRELAEVVLGRMGGPAPA